MIGGKKKRAATSLSLGNSSTQREESRIRSRQPKRGSVCKLKRKGGRLGAISAKLSTIKRRTLAMGKKDYNCGLTSLAGRDD